MSPSRKIMDNSALSAPRLCVLTQTASDVRPYYRQLFEGFDLFFVTFKQKNPEAVDFLPGSTWSDGRNRLWEHVKGRYDYYLFIDDDIEFFTLPPFPTTLGQLLQRKMHVQEKLRIRPLSLFASRALLYRQATPQQFQRLLLDKIKTYQPMVASIARTPEMESVAALDRYSLLRNCRVRPVGWFDAQVTLFSEVGARLLLPYDTEFSGWWSSQIPIYLLAYLAFGKSAISILDLAAQNAKHSVYRAGYDGVQDCLAMSKWLSEGLLNPTRDALDLPDGSFIDQAYVGSYTKQKVNPAKHRAETLEGVLAVLGTSFDLHHPYIYSRHKELVDALDAKPNGKVTEKVHG